MFGSLFAFAAGLLVIGSGVLPRWLGGISILVGILFFLQGFGLGGVIATFGLVLDGIGFVLLLIFVLVSSVLLLRRESAVPSTSGGDYLSVNFVQQEVQQRGGTPARRDCGRSR